MKKTFASLIFCSLIFPIAIAQNKLPWNGKKAAVVLTYDDAINEHLDNAVPILDSLALKATFYITGFSASMQARLNDWKKLAVTGHELGNHTLFHPCTGGPGREWVKPDQDLSKYTIQRFLDETRATNVLLQAMDGKTKRTFAFTCGDTKIGDSSFAPLLAKDFVAMRSVRGEMHPIGQVDLNDVDCYVVNGETGDQLIAWAKKAVATNSLLVILFHGVGGGNSLNVSLPAHRQFLQYLQQQQKEIWVAPMIEVAEYIKKFQKH
ncbi:MAG: polysaccharide deacetylase family protein [Chitinophagaceae bacterium]